MEQEETYQKNIHNLEVLSHHFYDSTIRHPPFDPIKKIRYRNKVNVVFGFNETDEMIIGVYRETGSRILHPVYNKKFASNLSIQISNCIQEWVNKYSRYPVYHFERNEGLWRNITIRENNTGQVMLIFHVHQHPDIEQWKEMEFPRLIEYLSQKSHEIQTQIPNESAEIPFEFVSVYYQITNTNREMTRYDPYFWVWGEKKIVEEFQLESTSTFIRKRFFISPGAFFQIHHATASKIYYTLYKWIKHNMEENYQQDRNTILWDLCCGTGIISIYLQELFTKCIGIDSNPYGIEDALENIQLNEYNPDKFEYICAKVEQIFDSLLIKNIEFWRNSTGYIVINPPRRGLYSIVLNSIYRLTREMDIPSIYYVSCSIETLKRDLDYLKNLEMREADGIQYQMKQMITINQFPGTEHSEVIVELRKTMI
jgi:tRNA (uracil-5-)-methyltransferase